MMNISKVHHFAAYKNINLNTPKSICRLHLHLNISLYLFIGGILLIKKEIFNLNT